MRATKKSEMVMNQVAVTTENLQNILDCGRPTAVEIGTLAKARVEIGRRVLWNVNKIKDYLDAISQ